MTDSIPVVQYGLGPIGCATARLVNERAGLVLVGGVDIDPSKVGRDVGDVIGLPHSLGIPVTSSLTECLRRAAAEVVVHTTSSYFDLFKEQIVEILGLGLDVVSTSEELVFPWISHEPEAKEIDACAKEFGKTVLGTGVNPGFVMDSLPLYLTGICQHVARIDVKRIINASLRRGPFQLKIGAGLTVGEFEHRMASGRMGHVGLPESMEMVFHTLGKSLVTFETELEPLVADRLITTQFVSVEPGCVRGLKQTARGLTSDQEFMTLTFIAALEAQGEGDSIKISGHPSLDVEIKGTNGDLATAAIAVNAIKRVRSAAPGLITMRDMPMATVW